MKNLNGSLVVTLLCATSGFMHASQMAAPKIHIVHNRGVETAIEFLEKEIGITYEEAKTLLNQKFLKAVQDRDVKAIEKFFARTIKPDINAKDKRGWPVLMGVMNPFNLDLIRLLIDLGADVNFKSKYTRQTPLDFALDMYDFSQGTGKKDEIIKLLKSAGAVEGDKLSGYALEHAWELQYKYDENEIPVVFGDDPYGY